MLNLLRIEKTLHYIEQNIDKTITVETLATHSHCSRWQFQRVFKDMTGLSVAQYVRQLRLSLAASHLLRNADKQIDIALRYGFNSEISFNRAFRQYFKCSPGHYRKRGKKVGIQTPLKLSGINEMTYTKLNRLPQVRVETMPSVTLYGVFGEIKGLFAKQPNFAATVPLLWHNLNKNLAADQPYDRIGIVDTTAEPELIYWAGIKHHYNPAPAVLSALTIPEQQYAVLPHYGHIKSLPNTLRWFFEHWLAGSGYCVDTGYDLEVYGFDYSPTCSEATMEYWLPVLEIC